jgi:leucyl aminopeptidase
MYTPVTCFITEKATDMITIIPVVRSSYNVWLAEQSSFTQQWLHSCGMTVENGSKPVCIPNAEGRIEKVIVLVDTLDSLWSIAGYIPQLPNGNYHIVGLSNQQYEIAAVGWGLANYKFKRYKNKNGNNAKLFVPADANVQAIQAQVAATYLVRDLINTPAEDMGPAELGEVADMLATKYGANVKQIVGDELLTQNFPAIHAVGRASTKPSRLIDLTWGDANAPKVTLVGKGVCFDSGGLDLKSSGNMRLMKKDMGGAAHVLGLAAWIMANQLPIRLRVIIGAVENMVAGNAYRPGDIVKTRKGLTVEIGNTDAEGRVVLSDALALACEDNPQIIIDYATLTGAARVGLGPDIPNMFTNDNILGQQLQSLSNQCDDLVWQMPLHKPYREFIDSSIADISNDSSSPYGGALTAALFLQEFVTPTISWVHFDVMAWNVKARAGRPEGGEAMAMRAVYAYLASLR